MAGSIVMTFYCRQYNRQFGKKKGGMPAKDLSLFLSNRTGASLLVLLLTWWTPQCLVFLQQIHMFWESPGLFWGVSLFSFQLRRFFKKLWLFILNLLNITSYCRRRAPKVSCTNLSWVLSRINPSPLKWTVGQYRFMV